MIAAHDLDIELLGSGSSRSLGERLTADLDTSDRAAIAVAFAKRSALTELALDDWCADGRKLELVAGTDFALTELELLERLSQRAGADCRVFHKAAARTVFHPKLYVLDQPATGSRVAYVGSANLTGGGLRHNFESVVRMAGPRDHPSLLSAEAMFSGWFDSEYATPLDADFQARYRALQRAQADAESSRWQLPEARRFFAEERLALAQYRAEQSAARWLLVSTPENYEISVTNGWWGRQHESEIVNYQRGNVFFMHVSRFSAIMAMGMFVDEPFYDDAPLWTHDDRGTYPWRVRLSFFGRLQVGLPTKQILAPLRRDAPKRWFNGFIQASHRLADADFHALAGAFRGAVRVDAEREL
jgi:HKD family nuclease